MKKDKALLIRETAGIWKSKGDGVSYVREIRKEWNVRARRLKL